MGAQYLDRLSVDRVRHATTCSQRQVKDDETPPESADYVQLACYADVSLN